MARRYTEAPGYEGPERRSGRERRDEQGTAETIAGGASFETLAGAAALVLAIIGLAGYLTSYMAAISTIAIGAALLAYGGSLVARWKDLARGDAHRREDVMAEGGLGTEAFGGAAGIVLGILALARVAPLVVLPVAAIVVGAALLVGGSVERATIRASGGGMVMAGLGAVVLGIIALVAGGPQLTLTLIAMLAIGGAMVLSGGALAAIFARRMHRFA